jgi:hypothetical protein
MSMLFPKVRLVLVLIALASWLSAAPAGSSLDCTVDGFCDTSNAEDCGNCWQDCYDVLCWCGDDTCEDCEKRDGECGFCDWDCGECESDLDCLPGNECCGLGGGSEGDTVCCEMDEYCDLFEQRCIEIPQP